MLGNNKNPLVSVVLPVHNGEDFLEEALESILEQTFQDYEVIVIDDASTDGTVGILEKFAAKDERVKYWTVEKQKSVGNVLNIAVKKSSGKYLVRMDHDDVMLPERITRQVDFMDKNLDVVVLGGQVEIINEKGEKIRERKYALTDNDLKKNLFLFSPFAHPAVIMRKDILEEVGLYPEITKVEDIKLWFLLSKEGKFANLPDVILKYRVHSTSESLSKLADQFWKTDDIRKWAMNDFGYDVDIRQRFWWLLQCVVVRIAGFMPGNLFMWLFETFRRIVG